jgi:hypothetical protein
MPRGTIVSALNLGMSRTMLTILLTVIPAGSLSLKPS